MTSSWPTTINRPWSSTSRAGSRSQPPPARSRRLLPPEPVPTPAPSGRSATSTDKGHGRRETRTLEVTRILTVSPMWKGLKQGFKVTRERMVKGARTVEVVHGITSLSAERADAATLLGLVRDHWRIENPLHYVRDVTLGEDACRVRKGTAPQVLAALRNAVVHLLSGVRAKNHPEAIEQLQIHPDQAQALIGIPQCE
ncbi:ISAs1 family transposase [Gemmata sp. SH-PL17]|uniref:ISAs1 family transposase n=1 Tax=Gemmata sp. SH-PL17 TaxID=1630693 RepID=UPI0012F71232|nr:ISAs1 family transposase [Gemmata sp. SH-PL17]